MTVLVCIGDSIVKGDRVDSRRIGWVGRLQEKLAENEDKDWRVYNLGIDGDKSPDVNIRLLTEVLLREPDVMIMSVGLNDLSREGEEGARINSVERLNKWNKILNNSAKNIKDSIVLGVPPIIDEKHLNDDEIKEYNVDLATLCGKYENIHFMESPFKGIDDLSKYYGDDIHPDDAGYDYMFEKIYNKMGELDLL
jgi:lysophospholipase L1-like esterase